MEDRSSHRESRSSQSNSSNFLPLLGSSLVCGAWPRGARRLPLAAPGRLAAGLSPPQSCPSLRAFARAAAEPRSRLQCRLGGWVLASWVPAPACLPLPTTVVAPGPRPGGQSLVAPRASSVRRRRLPPLGAPDADARYGWIVDWDRVDYLCNWALGFRV